MVTWIIKLHVVQNGDKCVVLHVHVDKCDITDVW